MKAQKISLKKEAQKKIRYNSQYDKGWDDATEIFYLDMMNLELSGHNVKVIQIVLQQMMKSTPRMLGLSKEKFFKEAEAREIKIAEAKTDKGRKKILTKFGFL